MKRTRRSFRSLSPIVGDAGVSIEVFADLNTSAERMLAQGEEMFSWIPNAYIKYPCTHEGLRAAATVGAQKHSREHDVVFLTRPSRRGVRGHERHSESPRMFHLSLADSMTAAKTVLT